MTVSKNVIEGVVVIVVETSTGIVVTRVISTLANRSSILGGRSGARLSFARWLRGLSPLSQMIARRFNLLFEFSGTTTFIGNIRAMGTAI